MSVSDELLDKYFKGLCTPEEKLLITDYLNKGNDLSNYLSKEEWDKVNDAEIADAKSDEIFRVIKRQTTGKEYRVKWIEIISAAAFILVILIAGLLNYGSKQTAVKLAKNSTTSKKETSVITNKSVRNYTNHIQLLVLPDQSTARIYPGAELHYPIPFQSANREVYLTGKSFFQVTKDKKHPFIVYANGISTTALGTSFTITAASKSRFIKVRLHTGKVWVKNVDSTHGIKPFNKILMPGNELVYNRVLNKVKVINKQSSVEIQQNDKNELNFSQASLVDVFVKLQQHYKTKINYNPADLEEMSFTGTLKLTQPLDSILNEIAGLNRLNKIKTPQGYLIRK